MGPGVVCFRVPLALLLPRAESGLLSGFLDVGLYFTPKAMPAIPDVLDQAHLAPYTVLYHRGTLSCVSAERISGSPDKTVFFDAVPRLIERLARTGREASPRP